jgi:hypothetical protein
MELTTDLYNADEIELLLQRADTAHLARDLGSDAGASPEQARADANQLRVAALLALTRMVGGVQVDEFLRKAASEVEDVFPPEEARDVFQQWVGYLTSLVDANLLPSSDDLLLYAVAGLIAREPTAVRVLLRQPVPRRAVDTARDVTNIPWVRRVRNQINVAVLLLLRQEHHADVANAGAVIRALAEEQRRIEKSWLAQEGDGQRDAAALLGMYHLAQAILRASEFLLVGSLESDGRISTDFTPELRRLLIRGEEYLSLASDIETSFWLTALAIVLWRTNADSIWMSGRGISPRLDELLTELARMGRERPVLSLLPSQQEALRSNLLDPTRIAVVLQMPTSAGKTLLAEFSIVQVFETYRTDVRVVYVTPTRALATQMRRALTEDLGPLGIQVSAAGSAFEEDPYEMHLLESTDGIVVATPEKLDLLFRAHRDWFKSVRLVVVDEAHLLHDSERGVRLELLLANIRREQGQARLLLLTPFVKNAEQIAAWLGGRRGLAISVHWRPSRILLGLASISGAGANRALTVEWLNPFGKQVPQTLRIPTRAPSKGLTSASDKVVFLAERFKQLGTILALFANSPLDAEEVAVRVSEKSSSLPTDQQTPALRVAIALARSELGPDSALARCLERGVAFHHSSLSATMRYLIEDQVRAKSIHFIAATTTLAQGVNFPVATVLVQSVAKPYGKGNLTPAEFWNIAGRAGRVGLADKGLIIFADKRHSDLWKYYSDHLTESVESALLAAIREVSLDSPLKEQYREHPVLRPFFQYLAHAAATFNPRRALDDLDELLQASLANAQVVDTEDARKLRALSDLYLSQLSNYQMSTLRSADITGLGSFSYTELSGKVGDDPLLRSGPDEILRQGQEGVRHLIEALKWLPEFDLGIHHGEGDLDVAAVARVVQGWIDGKTVPDLATSFPGDDRTKQIRACAAYLFRQVSQLISWGTHAYIRSWLTQGNASTANDPSTSMLPAFIQYGVRTPEAALASLLSVPRQFAEAVGAEYRERHGTLSPEEAGVFKKFIEDADAQLWSAIVARSPMADQIDPSDVRAVWRQIQGIAR